MERKSIANNLVQIFEGATIVMRKEILILLFLFQRISYGGINSLFDNGLYRNDGTGERNIFIDYDYNKFFLDMKMWNF